MAAFCKLFANVGSLGQYSITKCVSSSLKQLYGMCSDGLLSGASNALSCQVRTKFTNKHMWKDYNRRKTVAEYAVDRLRVNSLRRNTILPRELREIADKEIQEFPRNACRVRLVNRCVVTSRPRGKLRRWRISRFVFRHLADYNKLSGVTRAWW